MASFINMQKYQNLETTHILILTWGHKIQLFGVLFMVFEESTQLLRYALQVWSVRAVPHIFVVVLCIHLIV